MEFGDDGPAAAEHLARQLATIAVIEGLAGQVRFPPAASSDLDVLVGRTDRSPVDLGHAIQNYLQTSLDCLHDLRAALTSRRRPSTVALQSLLRPMLMTSGRIVYVLGSDDREIQFERAMTVMRQECDSYLRALKAFSRFRHLPGLQPPPTVVAEVEEATKVVRASSPRRGEADVLDEMAERIAAEVAGGGTGDDVDRAVLGETVTHAWHTFSGGAHGYVWPDNVPGDFISSLGIVVPVAHWSVDLAVRRTRQ